MDNYGTMTNEVGQWTRQVQTLDDPHWPTLLNPVILCSDIMTIYIN